MGDPVAVRVGPGKLYIAPIGSSVPTDLDTPWDMAWVEMGYTNEGSNFVFNNTFEDVVVAEELEPIATLQTARQIDITFALAELTAANMQRAFNGGDIQTANGVVTYEPPPAGQYTAVMIGWEADDGLERWVFRRCIQVGSVDIARRRAPDKATLPMTFRVNKPSGEQAFVFMHAEDYAEAVS
jgi:hypothetical protein